MLAAVLSFFLLQAGQPDAELVAAQSLIDSAKLSEAESAVRKYLQGHPASADGHYLLAYILFREGDPKSSLSEFNEGARYRAPGALDMQVAGSDYFLMEDYTAADKWLSSSVERNPKDAVALYFLGRTKYNEKRFDEAAGVLARCLEIDPANVRAAHYLALSYEQVGKVEDALKMYERAAAQNSGVASDPGIFTDFGALLLSNGRVAEALPYLEKAVGMAGTDTRARRELAKAYISLNRLADARTQLESAVEIAPQEAQAHYLLAQVYRKQGLADKAKAEEAQYTALSGSHSAPENPLAEARSLLELGKPADAERVVRRYLQTHRNSADGYYLLGYVLFKQQKAKESLAAYTQGAKYRRPNAYDLEVVGADYVLLDDYSNADKWFSKSVEWEPGNRQAIYYLGRAKYNENRFEEAIDAFQRCLKLDPKDIKAKDNLGLSYQGLGRNEEAAAAFRQAIEWQAGSALKDPGPYINLGALLLETGKPNEALPYLLEAKAIAPRDVKARRELGKAYMALNRLEDAQPELEKAVALAPQNAPAHFMLGQLYRKRGMAEKAKAEFGRYAELNGSHSTPETPER
jgi:tetratricopeptide (TPR) repeat protein